MQGKMLLAYLAGLFDGEGSFSIQVGLRQWKNNKPSLWFNPAMSLNLHYGGEILNLYRDKFGGSIYPHTKRGARWGLNGLARVVTAASTLEPYLNIKKTIAQRFLEALAMFPKRGIADQKIGERVWTAQSAIAVAEIALSLNPPRSRKSNKGAEYLKAFRLSIGDNYKP